MKKKNRMLSFRVSPEDMERYQKLVDLPSFHSWGKFIRCALEEYHRQLTEEAPLFDKKKKAAAPKKVKEKKP